MVSVYVSEAHTSLVDVSVSFIRGSSKSINIHSANWRLHVQFLSGKLLLSGNKLIDQRPGHRTQEAPIFKPTKRTRRSSEKDWKQNRTQRKGHHRSQKKKKRQRGYVSVRKTCWRTKRIIKNGLSPKQGRLHRKQTGWHSVTMRWTGELVNYLRGRLYDCYFPYNYPNT